MPNNPIDQPTPQELQAAEEAYERAAMDGLCEIGAREVAQELLKPIDLDQATDSQQT